MGEYVKTVILLIMRLKIHKIATDFLRRTLNPTYPLESKI